MNFFDFIDRDPIVGQLLWLLVALLTLRTLLAQTRLLTKGTSE